MRYLTSIIALTATSAVSMAAPASPDQSATSATYVQNGSKPTVVVKSKAPTSYDYEQLYAAIPSNARITMVISRQCDALGEQCHEVKRIADVAPGKEVSWTDSDSNLQYGNTYTYSIHAELDGQSSYDTYASALIGVQIAAPALSAVSDKGKAPVKITVKVPDALENGDDLEYPLTKLVLTRTVARENPVEVKVFDNPAAGATLSFQDNDVTLNTSYQYSATAYCDYGSSSVGYADVFVGKDIPQPVNSSTIEVEVKNNSIVIDWDPVTEGAKNGYLDPASVVYDIYRNYRTGQRQLMAQGITDTKYTDNVSDLERETTISMQVIARNEAGQSGEYTGIAAAVLVGPPAPMPFNETFSTPGGNGVISDYIWTESSPSAGAYNCFVVQNWTSYKENDVQYSIYSPFGSEESPEGFLSCEYNEWNQGFGRQQHYISTPIHIYDTENPVLSLYYFSIPGSDCLLDVQYTDADNVKYYRLNQVRIGDNTEPGWNVLTCPFPNLENAANIRILLNARITTDIKETYNIQPVCVDNILIDSYPWISSISYKLSGNDVTLEWVNPSTATQSVQKYNLYRNDELIATLDNGNTTKYVDNDAPDGTNVYAIEAEYHHGIMSSRTKITVDMSGIEGIMDDPDAAIHYDLNGNVIDFETAGHGVYIRQIGSKATKVIK